MRLGHVVKGKILDLMEEYQNKINDMVETTEFENMDKRWWDIRKEYIHKLEALEELMEKLDGKN